MSAQAQKELWNRRYLSGGHLWGTDPSPTVKLLNETLNEQFKGIDTIKNIITIGYGTARDEASLAVSGCEILAIDVSDQAKSIAERFARERGVHKRITFICDDFAKVSGIRDNSVNGISSHRTLHLLEPQEVEKFVDKAFDWLEPGGLLAVSARNFKDFDPDEMEWVDGQESGIAKYKDPERDGHVIYFWNEKRFEDNFSNKFNIISFMRNQESESIGSNKTTKYTIMLAQRKPVMDSARNQIQKETSLVFPDCVSAIGRMAARVYTVYGQN